MEVHTVEIEPMRVIGLSHSGPYQTIGGTFDKLHEMGEASGITKGPLVAIYFDDPHNVPEEKLRSVAGVIVGQDVPAAATPLQEFEIPGGKYAMTSFVGNYSKLGKAWEDFYGSIFGSGLKTKADLCFERYVTVHGEAPPDELITELYAPLA